LRGALRFDAARRGDFLFRPESLERVFLTSEKTLRARLRRFDGDARFIQSQRIRGARVGIMKHGRLMTEMATEEIGHADLERIYLENTCVRRAAQISPARQATTGRAVGFLFCLATRDVADALESIGLRDVLGRKHENKHDGEF
jgi:hypothetical protein